MCLQSHTKSTECTKPCIQTQPINSIIIQIQYPLNNRVFAIIFSSQLHMQRYTTQNLLISILHRMVCDQFLQFQQSGRYSFSVHFMNNITYSASLLRLPSLSLKHKAKLNCHLANILSNNPFPFLAILQIKAASRAQ